MKYAGIAIRNLNRQKKRSVLLGGAIALGILVITMINSFTAGAVRSIRDNFSYLLAGHIYISEEIKRDDDTRISRFDHADEVREALSRQGIPQDQMVFRSELTGQFIFNGRSINQAVIGVDWQDEQALRERLVLAEGTLEEVISDPRSLIVSLKVARQLGVELGEEITLRTSTVTGQQNVGSFVVRGFMADPGILGSLAAYAQIDRVNELLNIPPGSFQSINITLDHMDLVDPVTEKIRTDLAEGAQVAGFESSGLVVMGTTEWLFTYEDKPEEPWEGYRFLVLNINDMVAQIDELSATVNQVGLGVLVVLLLVTMIGVVNTFRMIMYERTKEIGTMRALGMQRKVVRRIFLYEASSLAAMSYVFGTILAVIVGRFLTLIKVPSDNAFSLFTNKGIMSFPLEVPSMVFNLALILIMTTLAALIPARKAAKLQPADALRS